MTHNRPIAVIHNRYLETGGEDAAVAAHVALLKANECPVVQFETSNTELVPLRAVSKAAVTFWNGRAYRELRAFFARERPRVAHFHNTFPFLSPAVYTAATRERIPVVQSLHNYRLVCPNALLFRDGHPCEDCLEKRVKWPGVTHACYRRSHLATAITAGMLAAHELLGTWTSSVHRYIAFTEFARRKFIRGGLPAERIVVNPPFLAVDPGRGEHSAGFALFVGRLSPEKGIGTLLDAWQKAGRNDRTLKIVGSGPLEATNIRSVPGVEWLGQRSNTQVLSLMREAAFLVFPSECYEAFPHTLLEALASGLPVIVSNHGAMAEIVSHRASGYHFVSGDAVDLARALDWGFDHPLELADMGALARAEFETKYSAALAYGGLLSVYSQAEDLAKA